MCGILLEARETSTTRSRNKVSVGSSVQLLNTKIALMIAFRNLARAARQTRSLAPYGQRSFVVPTSVLRSASIPAPRCTLHSYTRSSARTFASAATGANSDGPKVSAPPPDMESSLKSIIPEELFTAGELYESHKLPRDEARHLVEAVLSQLRKGVDAKTVDEARELQGTTDVQSREYLRSKEISADTLHRFTLTLMKTSRDPRRTPISFRLFAIAFGKDPESLPDPTAENIGKGMDESLASEPIAGEWGINAAGYSWASMILSGQAPPPAGLHVLPKGTDEAFEAVKDQQAAAVRIYATLAMRGDPQGMLGMGRVLMAGTQRHEANLSEADAATVDAQTKLMRDRAVALWTKAGSKGVGEAWFELGLLTLGTGKENSDEAKASGYFELGAKEGDARCHHALGVLCTQSAMADKSTPPSAERGANLEKSLEHFQKAAESGDGQSAHHLGLRYLLRDEMVQEIGLGSDKDGRTPEQVRQQASQRHKDMWGVEPSDATAREWFRKGSGDQGDGGFGAFVPSMLNYAGMLVEGRGAQVPLPSDAQQPTPDILLARMQDLKRAESLYAKVAAHTGAVAQQSTPGQSQELDANKQMAAFAQQALGQVQGAIEETAKLTQGSQKAA